MLVEQTYQTVALADVRPHPANPRRGDVASIVASVEANGFYGAMIVQKSTGLILAGNHRFYAAQESGMDKLPAIVVDVDDDTARRILVVDNRSNDLASYDDEALAEVLREIAAAPGGLTGSGFDGDDLDALIASLIQLPQPLDDPDAVPDVPAEPVSVLGDVWLLGPHRVMCGDSTATSVVATVMAGALADMVFTDPPYGVGYDGGTKVREKLAGDETTDLYGPACLMAAKFSKPDAALYLWHAGIKGIAAAAAAAAAGYEIRCEIVWNKNQAQFGALSAQYKQKHEPAYYCFKRGKIVNWCGPTNEVTVWDVDRAAANEFHPTQKPVGLAVRALANHRAPIVLDLFGGSGSTLIAAHVTGRVARLIELDPGYVDVICRRYQDTTGTKPVLESTGEPHDFTAVDG